ncbi:calcium-binding protein PBP1-like, partial [Melia azedarach]
LVVFHGSLSWKIHLLPTYIYTFHLPQSLKPSSQIQNSLLTFYTITMAAASQNFQDFLPVMAHKLGGDGLIGELCNGFNLLMDADKGVITFESLKKNSALLGLQDLSDDDLRCMLKEGDFDGDGALNQMEFCVLMFRLSPELMDASKFLVEEALEQEFRDFH